MHWYNSYSQSETPDTLLLSYEKGSLIGYGAAQKLYHVVECRMY